METTAYDYHINDKIAQLESLKRAVSDMLNSSVPRWDGIAQLSIQAVAMQHELEAMRSTKLVLGITL